MHAFTDFPPSDSKISKSAILDFRFIDNNQENLRMFSTIARSSNAPKLLKPKNKIIDPTFPYKTGLKTTLTPFCTFFLWTNTFCFSLLSMADASSSSEEYPTYGVTQPTSLAIFLSPVQITKAVVVAVAILVIFQQLKCQTDELSALNCFGVQTHRMW